MYYRLGRLAGCVIIAFLLLVSIGTPLRHVFEDTLRAGDFRAFYCGARVVVERENPYLYAPLQSCQRLRTSPPGTAPGSYSAIDPAPLPAYDFALVAPLSLLPFYPAALLWEVMLVACIVAIAFLVSRLAGIPFIVSLAGFAAVEGYRTISYGQLPPLVILALCGSAMLLKNGRGPLAGGVAAASMLEPHIGLPACLALFLWFPATRIALLAAGFVLVVLAVLAVGVDGNVQYLAQVLPVHQLSELGDPIQYSLTWLLHQVHVGDRLALRLGSIDYALMLAFGVLLAPRVARAFGSPVPLVLFPPAVAMLGGPFVHLFEIGVAMPFALYAAGRAPKYRPLAWASATVLALDWPAMHFLRLDLIEAFAIVSFVLYLTRARAYLVRGGFVAGAFVLYASFSLVLPHLPGRSLEGLAAVNPALAATFDARLASTHAAIERPKNPDWHESSLQTVVGKAPTWAALFLICVLAVALARLPAPPLPRPG